MDHLPLLKRPDVGKGRIQVHAGVPRPCPDAVDGHEPVACADDLLQLDGQRFVRLAPALHCSRYPLVAVKCLARVVGENVVLKDGLGIEERQIG